MNYTFKNGEIIDISRQTFVEEYKWTFNSDDTFSMIRYEEEGTPILEYYGHYELRGSVVTLFYDRILLEGEPFDMSELGIENEVL